MLILNTQQNVTCTVYSLIKQIAVNYIILFTKDKVFVTAQKICFTWAFDVIVVH